MGLLDRFEQSMERLLEGATGSLFRQKLQPAEIGKKLERAMLSQQRASVGSKLVPNAYVVRLHPRDYAQFEGYASGLSRQLESWLSQVATQRQLTLLERISVSLEEDASAPHRNPIIDASITDHSRREAPSRRRGPAAPQRNARQRSASVMPALPIDATSAFEVPSRQQMSRGINLRGVSGVVAGQLFDVRDGSSTIGRSPENTIVIDAPDVSRRHARLERTGDHLRIHDLNSTNGTRVNGEAVHISDIQPGDEIRFGGQVLTVDVDGAGASGGQGWW